MSKYRFHGRTAIITGGAGDIGKAIARLLVQRGMNVVIADLNQFAAETAVTELGDTSMAFVGDLTDESVMQKLIDQTEAHFGTLDLLIPNIAFTGTERFHVRSTESIRHEINIIMIAPLVMMRLAMPALKKSDDPRIITTTSLGGIQPLRETPIYSGSKFGLRGACLSIALDEELHGIKISTVAPTATDTQSLREEALSDGNVLNFIDKPQVPEDVAKVFIRALERPRLESYPKTSDSLLSRFAMLFPNLQPKLLPLFERKGRKGLKKYINELRSRGLVEEVDGELRLTPRADRNPDV